MTVKHNAYYIASRLDAVGPAMERALEAELDIQEQLIARQMRTEAPKFLTTLTESIHPERVSRFVRVIAPGVDYAPAVHDGVKPGKGLPRFFDPEAGDIVKWLESKIRGTAKRPRRNSRKFTAAELELRDRYMGLSWHIRLHGTKANPFVERTVVEMASSVVAALKAAAARGVAGNGSGALA